MKKGQGRKRAIINFSGAVSVLAFLCALVFFLCGVELSIRIPGQQEEIIAVMGCIAFFISLLGMVIAITDLRTGDRRYLFSKIGLVLNGLTAVGIGIIYIQGINL